ncbi:MAG: M15 family metallopeptidase [Treponema sp.]|nr:M15 family metallopeptidase [Treponema sp.]
MLFAIIIPLFAFALPKEPENLQILRKAYPNVNFSCTYDKSVQDYKITLSRKNANLVILYWADGKMLPKEKLSEKESYWNLLYPYAKEIPDPANFSKDEINRIKNFSSAENRSKQAGSSLYFFNAIYDAATKKSTERHIKQVSFLGKYTNAHEFIFGPLARVEKRIRELAKTDSEVAQFITDLARVDSYNWREIGDRNSRSFHSYGIAVDILPRGWGQKNIYWAWRRDIDPNGWMTLPLEKRWIPPLAVINAFEEEGFIWGGKWIIWDNMHFEYHPELVAFSKINNTSN